MSYIIRCPSWQYMPITLEIWRLRHKDPGFKNQPELQNKTVSKMTHNQKHVEYFLPPPIFNKLYVFLLFKLINFFLLTFFLTFLYLILKVSKSLGT